MIPAKAAEECWRVLKPGGELLITVPNRWFPCENHAWHCAWPQIWPNCRFVTYLPLIPTTQVSDARVFTVRALVRLFWGVRL